METGDLKVQLGEKSLCNQLDRKKNKIKWRYYSFQCTKYEEEQDRHFLKLSEMMKDFSSAKDEEKKSLALRDHTGSCIVTYRFVRNSQQ